MNDHIEIADKCTVCGREGIHMCFQDTATVDEEGNKGTKVIDICWECFKKYVEDV